jgi:hypothetical protein
MRTNIHLLFIGCVAGCVTNEPTTEPPPHETGSDTQPPMPVEATVDIDWQGDGVDVDEITLFFTSFGGNQEAAVQMLLKGSVTAPGGTKLLVQLDGGGGGWERGAYNSDDYTSGACGSWQALQTQSFGLMCQAAGGPYDVAKTDWNYAQSKLVTLEGTPDAYHYTAKFVVRAKNLTRGDLLDCRYVTLDVVQNTTTGLDSSFSVDPCPSWEWQ